MNIKRTTQHAWLHIPLLLITSLLCSLPAFAVGLQASLDRSHIVEGETVMLRLSVPGQLGTTPDLSPLMQDFEILDRSQSTRMQVINGYASSSQEWQLILGPKRTGNLLLPALQAGQQQTQPLTLVVTPAQQVAQTGASLPVALEVEASPLTPYVQGKVIYNTRLWVSVPMTRTNLGDPEGHGVVIEPLGDFKRRTLRRGGKEYLVVERSYAIFPQQSGPLEIKGPVFTGELAQSDKSSQGRRSPLFGGSDPFARLDRLLGGGSLPQRSRMFYMRGRNISLDVQPQPAGASQPWLPAEAVNLEEAWSLNLQQLRVGEPVTRSVTLNARGVTGAQLPDLTFDSVPGIAIYQDKSQVQTRTTGAGLLARKVFKAAYVPSWAGTHQLPEITLSWWDTYANQQRVARIPARTIEVLPGAGGAGTGPPRQTTPAPAKTLDPQPTTPAENTATSGMDSAATWFRNALDRLSNVSGRFTDAGFWPWLTALFALAWLFTTYLFWRNRVRKPRAPASEQTKPRPANPKESLRQLRRACEKNDPHAARGQLLAWAKAIWPDAPPQGLDDLSRRLPGDAAEQLADLDRELYAPGQHGWDGSRAWGVLSPALQEIKPVSEHVDSPVLPPLYPSRN